ncbi:hypothetical protein ACQE3D_10725 [Methylomonas sp. MS20]|uniref:hypothetical protein n=1 Tax=unclassified Methylomonas TaxID=2608980 RepID=UPI0028A2E091|nr:hypothetical protein [Methylomonas sp. MV1]MDT4328529.1 hypothetical protein [Methylomonas sp. MV1]
MSNACAIPCPYCGKDVDIVQALEMVAGNEWTGLLNGLPLSLVGALLRYLELFKPNKQELRWSRRLALTKELVPLIKDAQIKRNGIVYSAPAGVWEAEMMRLVVNRPENLVLPLKGNGYLLSMIAGRGERAAAKLEQDKIEKLRNRSAPLTAGRSGTAGHSSTGGAPVSVAELAEKAQVKTKSKPPAGWKGPVAPDTS